MNSIQSHHLNPTIIDWSPMLGFECQLVLTSWEQGLTAFTQTPDGVESMALSDLGDWVLENPSEAISAWRGTIPDEVRQALKQLPDRRLEALQLARSDRHAKDVLCSTPLLMWLLLEKRAYEIGRWLTERQVNVLAALGFDGTKQQINALRAIGRLQVSRRLLDDLIPLLDNKACLKYWSHNKSFGKHTLEVLVAYPWLADCPAKALIGHMADNGLRRVFSDTLGMLNDIDRLRRCTSPRALERLHDDLVETVNRNAESRLLVRDDLGEVAALPKAPLQATDQIVYLSDQQQIIDEGRKMRHCIASYLPRLVAGRYFVYHYDGDQALTIGIVAQHGQYRLDDIRGRRNASPVPDILDDIEAWFAGAVSRTAK